MNAASKGPRTSASRRVPPVIALVPLDDRPCSRDFPQWLARIAGVELRTPPPSLLGRFTRPGDPDAILDWLEQEVERAEAVLVAVDMLAYGGLVASRDTTSSAEQCAKRLNRLRSVLTARPELNCYAFSVLLRLSTTAADDISALHHELLRRYLIAREKADSQGDPAAATEADALLSQMPEGLLTTHLSTRQRNHAVNREMLEWVAAGALDWLLLSQEDCAEFGPHRAEQRVLREDMERLGVADRVALYPSTDEAALALLGKHLLRRRAAPVRCAVHYSQEEGADCIPEFEDRPLRASVVAQFEAIGMQAVDGDAECHLFVNTPVPFDTPPEQVTTRLREFASECLRYARIGELVGLADVRRPNGADPELIGSLCGEGHLASLAAFAGWNTAGNSLGTVLAHLAACLHAQPPPSPTNSPSQLSFLFLRFVDDWLYQSVVRPEIVAALRDEGLSPFNLGSAWQRTEGRVRRRLTPLAKELFEKEFTHPGGVTAHLTGTAEAGTWSLTGLQVELPWPRTFEARLTPRIEARRAREGSGALAECRTDKDG